jgi:alkanesulfonate monooxygenase SsuD/methylene tetrahydromethanopterin reductase-like flavin-dependent oxidoreductase (luciferase family)
MEAALHLPQLELTGGAVSYRRVADAVDAARESGFVAVSANDHFYFAAPWLDGPTVLAATAERARPMTLATTVSLPTLRGPVPVAKALLALHLLSGGRVIGGLGPGSSRLDHAAVGVAFEERWQRFEEAVGLVRALLRGEIASSPGRYYPVPQARMSPLPAEVGAIPLWIGSWGSPAGLRRVARLGDGWLASAYNTSPEGFAQALGLLNAELEQRGRPADGFPHALVTMWTWITEDRAEAEQILHERLAPLLNKDPATLRGRVCVGSAEFCAELLSAYALAGCRRVHFWPLGDEARQIELLATQVLPQVHP